MSGVVQVPSNAVSEAAPGDGLLPTTALLHSIGLLRGVSDDGQSEANKADGPGWKRLRRIAMWSVRLRMLAAAAVLAAVLSAHAEASVFDRFPLGEISSPSDLVRGPDGGLWFLGERAVGRMGVDGRIRVFARGLDVHGIAAGPDGNMWLTAETAGFAPAIVRLSPDGRLTTFTHGISRRASVDRIAAGPDNALWFGESLGSSSPPRLARISLSGNVMEFPPARDPFVSQDADIRAITTGPDGNLWFVSEFSVGVMTPAGQLRWLGLPVGSESFEASIVTGPDGNLWVAGLREDAVLRITLAGEMTAVKAPFGSSRLVFNGDGTMWVGGFEVLTRMTMAGAVVDRAHDPLGDSGDCGEPGHPGDGLAIDALGQVWAADLLGSSLLRLSSATAATTGPLAAVLPNRGASRNPHALATASDRTTWLATDQAFIRLRRNRDPEIVRRYRGPGIIDLAPGSRGTLWFTDAAGHIGRLRGNGSLRMFGQGLGGSLAGIALDSRGDPWFVEDARHRIGRLGSDGHVSSFGRGIPRRSRLLDIAPGPRGTMWFTDQDGRIGRITTRGDVRMFPIHARRHREPVAITRGPDDAMWFTDFRGFVSRISSRGRVREYHVGEAPTGITVGPDGALWFATAQRDFNAGLGRITTSGHISRYHVRHTCDTTPWNITRAPDGGLLLAESHGPVALVEFTPSRAL